MRRVVIVLVVLLLIVGFNVFINTINKKSMDNPTPASAMGKVSFVMADGVTIVGNYFESTSTKAVLLLHQNGMDKSSWGDLPLQLQAKGFAVLAIDLRGYGESTRGVDQATNQPKTYDYRQFTSENFFPGMMADITAARKFLQGKGKTEQDIIGASIGANLAIVELSLHTEPLDPSRAMSYRPKKNDITDKPAFDPVKADPLGKVRRIVAMSPGLDFQGIKTELPANHIKAEYEKEKAGNPTKEIYRFGPLPAVLLVSVQGDDYSAQTVKKLQEIMGEPLSLTLAVDGSAHGVNILDSNPQAKEAIVNFLAR